MIVLAGAFRAFPRRVRSASAGGLGLRGTRRRSARSDARCVLMRGGSGFWGRYARWARWNVRLGACEAVSAFRRAVSQSRCARRLRAGCTARRGLCSGWRVAGRRGLQAAFAAGLGGKRLHSCTGSARCWHSLGASRRRRLRRAARRQAPIPLAVGVALHFVENSRGLFVAFGGFCGRGDDGRCCLAPPWWHRQRTELVGRHSTVAVVARLVERVADTGAHSGDRGLADAQLHRDRVGCLEPDAASVWASGRVVLGAYVAAYGSAPGTGSGWRRRGTRWVTWRRASGCERALAVVLAWRLQIARYSVG